MVRDELHRRHVKVNINYEMPFPDTVFGNAQIFRQTCMNLLYGAATGLENTHITLNARHRDGEILVFVINDRSIMTKADWKAREELVNKNKSIAEIMESEDADINTQIGLVLARSLQWPVTFLHEQAIFEYRLTVPV